VDAGRACREHAEVNFLPGLGQSLERARAVCAECLVRDSCLAYALEHDERDGVWGGLSTRERNHLRGSGEQAKRETQPSRSAALARPAWAWCFVAAHRREQSEQHFLHRLMRLLNGTLARGLLLAVLCGPARLRARHPPSRTVRG